MKRIYPCSVGETGEFYTNWDYYNNRVNDIPKVEAVALLEAVQACKLWDMSLPEIILRRF